MIINYINWHIYKKNENLKYHVDTIKIKLSNNVDKKQNSNDY